MQKKSAPARGKPAVMVARHRSPLVLRCIEDPLAGQRLPLQSVYTNASLDAPELKC